MTRIEKMSNRKKMSILYQVKTGEMSYAYALDKTEQLHDEGKLIEVDYEELAEYLENLLNEEEQEEVSQEETEVSQEETEVSSEETNEEE